jgi:hypothetical protein
MPFPLYASWPKAGYRSGTIVSRFNKKVGMKQGWASNGWRALVMVVLTTLAAGVAAQDSRSGTLKTVQGTVVISQGEARRVAQPGGGVAEAERITTGPQSAAVLLLRDGTLITVGANTQVDISRFQFDATAQTGGLMVKVLVGTVRLVTGLLGKLQPDNVKVQTPSSTVAVRGTDFIVEVPQ